MTPESYLGLRSGSPATVVRPWTNDAEHTYRLPATLADNELAFGGGWRVERERAIAGQAARLRLDYRARDVYLVLTGTGSRASARGRQAGARQCASPATGSTRSSSARRSATTCSSFASARASRATRSRSAECQLDRCPAISLMETPKVAGVELRFYFISG